MDLVPVTNVGPTPAQIELIRSTVAAGANDVQLQLFLATAQRFGLDPIARQIHCVIRKGQDGPTMSIQTGIDGLRLLARRTGEFDGADPAQWCDTSGVWHDVWLSPGPPAAARVTVYRSGITRGFTATALYSEYVQMFSGQPSSIWRTRPAGQLAKCAEALALRMAFPTETGGLYADDEMQDSTPEPPPPSVGAAALEAAAALAANAARRVYPEPAGSEPATDAELVEEAVKVVDTPPDKLAAWTPNQWLAHAKRHDVALANLATFGIERWPDLTTANDEVQVAAWRYIANGGKP